MESGSEPESVLALGKRAPGTGSQAASMVPVLREDVAVEVIEAALVSVTEAAGVRLDEAEIRSAAVEAAESLKRAGYVVRDTKLGPWFDRAKKNQSMELE